MTQGCVPAVVVLGLLLPASALAQGAANPVDELKSRARTGDVIFVMNREGEETRGTLLALSDTTLTISLLGDRYDVSLDGVARIDREGDSAWGGFAIGASIGAVMGLLEGYDCSGDFTAGPMVGAALVYGGIGALIDYAHTGRTHLYHAPLNKGTKAIALAPLAAQGSKGLLFAVRWD